MNRFIIAFALFLVFAHGAYAGDAGSLGMSSPSGCPIGASNCTVTATGGSTTHTLADWGQSWGTSPQLPLSGGTLTGYVTSHYATPSVAPTSICSTSIYASAFPPNCDGSYLLLSLGTTISGTALTGTGGVYTIIPNLSPLWIYSQNFSGSNLHTYEAYGRTGAVTLELKNDNYSQGDGLAIHAQTFCGGPLLTNATTWLAAQNCTLFGGGSLAGADGVGVYGIGDVNVQSGAFDVAGIGFSQNLTRDIATGNLNAVWENWRPQSTGAKPIDSFNSPSGKTRIIDDFTAVTFPDFTLVQKPTMTSGGTGYTGGVGGNVSGTQGDLLCAAGGTADQQTCIRVLTVNGSGTILTFGLDRAGLYSTVPGTTTSNAFTGGTGTGATFTIQYTSGPINPAIVMKADSFIFGNATNDTGYWNTSFSSTALPGTSYFGYQSSLTGWNFVVSNGSIMQVTSDRLNLGSGISFRMNGTTVVDSSLNITGNTLTSTVATGTAPLTVASTTNVANLNASSLGGATFAAPGAIGGGTASAGTFTTATAATAAVSGNATASGAGIAGFGLKHAAATYTLNDGAQTFATVAAHSLLGDTFASTNAITGTDTVELYLGTPAGSGSFTATNLYSLKTSGQVSIGGKLVSNTSFVANGFANINVNNNANVGICTGTCNGTTTVGGASATTTIVGPTVNMTGLTASSAAQTGTLCVGAGGLITYDTTTTCLLSSARFKMGIKPLKTGLDEVMAWQPVSYKYKPEFNGAFQSNPNFSGEQVGFTAEQIQIVDPRLITTEANGLPRTVRYEQMVAVLTKAIQEQQAEIEELKATHSAPVPLWCRVFTCAHAN